MKIRKLKRNRYAQRADSAGGRNVAPSLSSLAIRAKAGLATQIPGQHNAVRAVHPGDVLKLEFKLKPRQIARATTISIIEARSLLARRHEITPEIAKQLSRYLGTTAEFWLNLQSQWDYRFKVPNQTSLVAMAEAEEIIKRRRLEVFDERIAVLTANLSADAETLNQDFDAAAGDSLE